MTPRTMLRTLVIALLLAGAAVGCSSSSKKSTSTTTSTSGGSKTFQIQTPEGQVSLSLDGKLPPNWPSEFPVAPGASPAGSGSLGNTSTTTLVGVYSTTGSAEDAFNFYKSTSAYDVDSSSSAGIGSAFVGSVEFSGSYRGSATIASLSGTTYIVIVLQTGGTNSTTTTTTGATTTTTVAATTTTI